MRALLLFLALGFLLPLSTPAQTGLPLTQARPRSYYTKVFRLTEAQARRLYERGLAAAQPAFFTLLADSLPTDSAGTARARRPLPPGYYLVAHTEGPELVYWLRSETDRQVSVFDNQVDLTLLVRDSLGRPLTPAEGARLALRGRPVPYDAATGTFRRAGGGRSGLLALTWQGRTTYHALERTFPDKTNRPYSHAPVRRVAARLLYGFPLGYLYRPVRQLAGELRYASNVYTGPIGLLRAAFSEDVREERRDRRAQEQAYGDYRAGSRRYTGFVALSQPRYRPRTDTLRLKARVLRRASGRPYRQPLTVWLTTGSGSGTKPPRRLAELRPVRPGSYELVLPLADSLQLTGNTQARVQLCRPGKARRGSAVRRGELLVQASFQVEDYELRNARYALRLAQPTEHRAGQSQAAYLRGTDANELSLLDARLRLVVRPAGAPGPFVGRQLFVPDTLLARAQPLDAVGETRLNLPETIFPAADLAYQVTATFLTSDNERHEETAAARRLLDPGQLHLALQADSLLARYTAAGAPAPHRAWLTVRGESVRGAGVVLRREQLTLPARLPLDPRATSYELQDSAGRRAQLTLTEENAGLNLTSERRPDSLLLAVDNPHRLAFRYFLYRGSRLVARGQGHGTAWRYGVRLANSRAATPWHVALLYLWGGQARAAEFTVPLPRRQLAVQADVPAVAYPGQRLTLRYTVTDAAGRPVPDADLTSYAYTSKFEQPDAPALPSFEAPAPGRVSRRRFALRAGFENTPEQPQLQPLNWAAWRGRLGLDSLRCYQFLFPAAGQFFDYQPAPGQLTQLAPFVLENGHEVPLLAIYLDGQPVWIHDVNHPQPYAVVAAPGRHQLALRTATQLLTLAEIYLRPAHKLTLSLNPAFRCEGLQVETRGPLRPAEHLALARSLLLFEPEDLYAGFSSGWRGAGALAPAAIQQGLNWQPLRWNAPAQSWLAGPLRPDLATLHHATETAQHFQLEPLYRYRFRPGEQRLRTAPAADYGLLRGNGYGGSYAAGSGYSYGVGRHTRYTRQGGRLPLGDFALTPAEGLARLHPPVRPGSPAAPRLLVLPPQRTAAGQGRLVVRQPGQLALNTLRMQPGWAPPAWLVLTRPGQPRFRQVVPGGQPAEGLAPGRYRLGLLLADSSALAPAGLISVPAGGTTYVQFDSADYQRPGSRPARQLNRLVHPLLASPGAPLPAVPRLSVQVETPVNPPSSWHTVRGQVLDQTSGEGLPGVTVLVKGTQLGVATNADGSFVLALPNLGSVLVFSSVGYVSQEWPASVRETMTIRLTSDTKQLNEAVVVGYGADNSQRIRSAVASTEAANVLQGKAAGVLIEPAGPEGGVRIRIRGTTSVGGQNAPLLIVDGLPRAGTLAELSPDDIASVRVLPGAEATGLYGRRAAGGVLIITTKRGPAAGQPGPPGSPGADPRLALRRRFRDYGWWQPTLLTDAQGQARASITLPDDVTAWDAFALASDGRGRLGSAPATRVRAFKGLRAELAAPRFLVAGDRALVLGKALNYLPDSALISTSFQVGETGPAQRLRTRHVSTSLLDTLAVLAPAPPTNTGAGGNTETRADSLTLTFRLRQASGYEDGERRTLPVLPAGSRDVVGTSLVLLSADTTLALPANPALGSVRLRLEADPLPQLEREIEHLSAYAYLCNEQVASKLLGLLLQQRVRQTQQQPFPQERQVRFLIRRLLAGQHPSGVGLWGTWPQAPVSPWATQHVLDALLAAEKQGYEVKLDREAVRRYLLTELDAAFAATGPAGYFDSAADRLRLLQLLHRLGTPLDYPAYLARLARSTPARAPLDHQLAVLEFRQALRLPAPLDSLRRYRRPTVLGAVFYADTLRPAAAWHYRHLLAGRVATTLQAYRLLRAAGAAPAELARLRAWLLNQRTTAGHWASTYETAQILATIVPDLLASGAAGSPGQFPAGGSAAAPGASVRLLSGAGEREVEITKFPYDLTLNATAAGGPLVLRKQGALPVYLAAYQTRWDPAPAPLAAPFKVTTTLAGQSGAAGPVRLRPGQPAELLVTVDVPAAARYVLLEIPIPAGCSYATPAAAPNSHEVHREYLRHQAGIFLDELPAGRHTFRVQLLPRYAGRYTLNPARAELMYFPSKQGRAASRQVIVK